MKINKSIAGILALSMTVSQTSLIIPFATINTDNYLIGDNNIETKSQSKYSTYKSELINDGNLAYSDKVFNLLYSSEEKFNEYLEVKDVSLLKKSIDIFCSTTVLLAPENDIELYEDPNFSSLFYKIRDEIYKIPDYDMQSNLITYYGEKIFIGWRKNKDITLFRDVFLKVELVEYNKDKNQKSQPRLDYLKELCLYFMINPDLDSNSDKIPNGNNYPPNNNQSPPGNNNNGTLPDSGDKNETLPGNQEDNIDSSTSNERFEEYIKKNNSCIKKVTFYKNGKATSTKEYPVSKTDYVKCGIYNYVHSNKKKPSTIIDRDYINSNQNEESEFTIHFTINKSHKYPYYYNTGIRTSPLDNSVTYNQLKDALYQLSIKSEGFSVTDNDKSLVIIEGKPIVLKKSKEIYSKLEVERLLHSFINAELKILKPKDNGPGTLNNYLSNKKIDKFLFKGETINLTSPFILVEEQLYGPIQEIATHLGVKTVLKDNSLTIFNDKTKITLNVNSKSYDVDKKEMIFMSSPIIHNSTIYSIVDVIISELGYEISWDDELGELSIYSK